MSSWPEGREWTSADAMGRGRRRKMRENLEETVRKCPERGNRM
jgi:hypothetical protein